MNSRQKGFTLIEVIVSLVIIGILSTLASAGIARIIQGYVFSKDNAETALKAQIVFTRLAKEFRSMDGVSAGTQTSLTYSYIQEGSSITGRTLSWAGAATDPLVLGGNILTDKVNDFEMSFHNDYSDPGDHTWNGTEKLISITLRLKGASDQISSFSTWIRPRNLP